MGGRGVRFIHFTGLSKFDGVATVLCSVDDGLRIGPVSKPKSIFSSGQVISTRRGVVTSRHDAAVFVRHHKMTSKYGEAPLCLAKLLDGLRLSEVVIDAQSSPNIEINRVEARWH